MLNRIGKGLGLISFRARIGILLILFTIIPSFVVVRFSQYIYENHIISQASGAIYSIVSANNQVIASMIRQVEDTSSLMLNDEEYYWNFSDIQNASVSDCMKLDRRIFIDLAREFSTQKQVFEAYFFTDRWIYGETDVMSTTVTGILDSGLVEDAILANGQPYWIGGYDYGKAVGSSFLQDKENYVYRYPITMVREMDFQYSYYADYNRLSKENECPILIVYILENTIRDVYEKSVEYEGSLYGIIDREGRVISSDNNRFAIGNQVPAEITNNLGEGGKSKIMMDGKEYMLSYATIQETGWLSFCLVPMDTLVKNTTEQARQAQYLLLGIFLLLSMVVAILFSRTVTRPVRVLMKASERVATGDFRADTPIPQEKEFKQLTESFNHMEKEISRLIHENYEIRLREETTRLKMLSMQINPHFLYNTLNTINMLAIRNGDEETSDLIVSLSGMLSYTLKNTGTKILLSDEISWLSDYLAIMSKRYQGVFVTTFCVDEKVQECLVPKFFLQPLVENAIRHGFEGRKEGGILRIVATSEREHLHIEVEDNGKGMKKELIKKFITGAMNDENIGMSNVHRRLMLLYGERYQVRVESEQGKGTHLHLYLPLEW